MKPIKLFTAALAMVLMATTSAESSAKTKTQTPAFDGNASFGYFEYAGNDDFYNANPLTDEYSFYNPVLAGWHSDPSICRRGNDYFMVSSTFGYFPGVPIFHSTDLVNWRQIGNVLNRPSQLAYLPGQDVGKGGIYAATIRYNPYNQLFYMITTDVGALPFDHGKGAGGMAKGAHFFVTTADPFANEWSDPVWLPDIPGIDPDLFFDDNGNSYIIHKEDTEGRPKWSQNRAIRIIRFDTATGKTFGEDVKFLELGVGSEEHLDRDEGPHLMKINGKYYVICAEGGTGIHHSEVVYMSDNVFGPYVRWARNPMITMRSEKKTKYPTKVTCTGHVDMVDDADGNWWAVFLASRPGVDDVELLGRETFMMPVRWNIEGFPYLCQSQDTVPMILRHEGVKRQPTTVAGNFVWRDEFTAPELAPEWVSLWGSPAELYTIERTGGKKKQPVATCLKMKPSATLPFDRQPLAYLGRVISHHKFTSETQVCCHMQPDEIAGMCIMRNETRNYIFGIRLAPDGTPEITLLESGKKNYNTLAAKPLDCCGDDVSLKLKIVSNGNSFDFFYAPADTDTPDWKALATAIPSDYVSQKAGGFTGTTIGICDFKIK